MPECWFCGLHAKQSAAGLTKVEGGTWRCRGSEPCKLRMRALLDKAEAESAVWGGTACREEQETGNGPCGSCRYCLPAILKETRRALRDSEQARTVLLHNYEVLLADYKSVCGRAYQAEGEASRAVGGLGVDLS